MSEYLTTKEVAELLRIKERKVYDLAASGTLPCSKAIGKLLFPRDQIEAWIAQHAAPANPAPVKARPTVFLGSHDPLLDWTLRESCCGIATLFDSSREGIVRFADGAGIATGLHVPDTAGDDWNIAAVRERFASAPVVLVQWAWRRRGLVVTSGLEDKIRSLTDLPGHRFMPRQKEAGSQIAFERALSAAGMKIGDLNVQHPARSENDVVQSVASGEADAGFALEAIAASHKAHFVPVIRERFDLLVDRRAWFDPPFQSFLAFCRSPRFAEKASTYAGYDVTGLGTVMFNGA